MVSPLFLLPSVTMCCLISPPYSCNDINLNQDSIQLKLFREKNPGALMQLFIFPLFCLKIVLAYLLPKH